MTLPRGLSLAGLEFYLKKPSCAWFTHRQSVPSNLINSTQCELQGLASTSGGIDYQSAVKVEVET